MTTHTSHSTDPAHTEALGEGLGGVLRAGDLVLLEGDLAAGKTTFVRGLLRGLGGEEDEVTSPSFVIVQSYPCSRHGIAVLHHVDLYRVEAVTAVLREIGIDEILSDAAGVVAVEWPRGGLIRWLPADARLWRVAITHGPGDQREVVVEGPLEG